MQGGGWVGNSTLTGSVPQLDILFRLRSDSASQNLSIGLRLLTGAVHLFNILFLSLQELYTFLIFSLVPRKISKEDLARWVPSHLSPHKILEEGLAEWAPSHSSPTRK